VNFVSFALQSLSPLRVNYVSIGIDL